MALLSDPLAARGEDIFAMLTLLVLSVLLALVMSRSTAGVGGSLADRQWFGATPAQMDFYCFSSFFHPLYCDGGHWWGRCYGQGLACWRRAWWRKTFAFSFVLLHLPVEFSMTR